jgi:starch synthase
MDSSQLALLDPAQPARPLRILMASSEAHPLVKTGGLADVAASLPAALRSLGHDARLILPAYPRATRQVREPKVRCDVKIPACRTSIRILEGQHPDHDLPVYLVEAPDYFSREGNPYIDLSGGDWGDNAERFLLFCRAIAVIAQGVAPIDWQPDVLHGNDWQTGLAPALMSQQPTHPATVFTIHNLAYQGLFDRATFDRLGLPAALWSLSGLEFHQRMSFIKGGIIFSERVNTVSPSYAMEVRTARFGCGLDGLLRQIGSRFSGILNGADYRIWDPATDPFILQCYDRDSFGLKAENKLDLQREVGLPRSEDTFLLGYIGRLVEQKGVDLILAILPRLLEDPRIQVVLQGTGDRATERALIEIAAAHPRQVGVFVEYDEARAHRIEAGADAFLMPSRFEPCGLNQIYSLRYGTPPIAHRTGGLIDTIVHTTPTTLAETTATGFLFDEPRAEHLLDAIWQALRLFRDEPETWRRLATTGMAQDFSWEASANRYLELYQEAIADRAMAMQGEMPARAAIA